MQRPRLTTSRDPLGSLSVDGPPKDAPPALHSTPLLPQHDPQCLRVREMKMEIKPAHVHVSAHI